MYICVDCGLVFEEPKVSREHIGDYWGEPVYEDESSCPFCRGDYEEAVKCEECGEYLCEDDVIHGICKNCIEKNININTALDFIRGGDIVDFYEFVADKMKNNVA